MRALFSPIGRRGTARHGYRRIARFYRGCAQRDVSLVPKDGVPWCRFGYARWDPGPYFYRAGASGIRGRQLSGLILVNAVGNRFYDETVRIGRQWRRWVAAVYDYFAAAMSSAVKDDGKKDGSAARSGQSSTRTRSAEQWKRRRPSYIATASSTTPLRSANSPRSSAQPVSEASHGGGDTRASVTATLRRLRQGPRLRKTEPKYKIHKPPFYAAWATPILHDTYAGLRVNGHWQVMDIFGKPIPGFYCAGRSVWRHDAAWCRARPGRRICRCDGRNEGERAWIDDCAG